MPRATLPIRPDLEEKLDRDLRRLRAQKAGARKDVERLLYKALIAARAAAQGVAGKRELVDHYLDAAIDAGLSPDAIRSGGNMADKIAAILTVPVQLAEAAGLLYEAADLLAQAGRDPQPHLDAADAITADPAEIANWRTVTRPTVDRRLL